MTTCAGCRPCQGEDCDEILCTSFWPIPTCSHAEPVCGNCCARDHGEATG